LPYCDLSRNVWRSRAGFLTSFDRFLLRVVFFLAHSGNRAGLGRSTGILHAFALAERLIEPWYRADPVQVGGILRYEITRLPRGTRPLPLDQPLNAGDPIIRLHFDNKALAQLSGSDSKRQHMAWEVTRRTERDLTVLADMVKAGSLPADTRAVWAEAAIYRAMARLGFETRAAKPSLRSPFARLHILGLMAIHGPPGFVDRDLRRLEHYQLGEAWMDLRDLVHRYQSESG
jgi:hypothetical protein